VTGKQYSIPLVEVPMKARPSTHQSYSKSDLLVVNSAQSSGTVVAGPDDPAQLGCRSTGLKVL
jgi:hypothetical protein